MASPLPPADSLQGAEASRPQCLSSDYGSEVNDAFPAALAINVAAEPAQGSVFPRNASRRVMELIRRSTGTMKPDGKGTPASRENTKSSSAGTLTEATEATNKADGERVAVPPASPRPSKSFDLRRKFTDMLGRRPRASNGGTGVLDWKSHETILKMLGYRPRGHGRPFADSYTLSGELGRGGFGVVREGTFKPDGEVCAVKVMPRDAVPDIGTLTQEVDILRRLSHHQVTRFIDFYEEPQTYYLVLEKVPGGELFDRIIAQGRFCEDDARSCMRSLLEALAYCHSQKIAHRDVKPENILFASLDVQDRTIKLADFGLARSVANGPLDGTTCGTPSYMAPESLKLLPHGTQVDCWSAGIVTHILLGGYAPFASSRTEKLFRLIKKGRVTFSDACWSSVTQHAKDFILALLKVDPDTRLNVEQALEHPWLTETGEGTDGDEPDLSLSLSKLRVFSAKRKFRMAIHTMIACQRLHGLASIVAGVEENGARGKRDSGGRGGSGDNRRWTFNPGTQARRPDDVEKGPVRASAYEKRRIFAAGRKATGIFVEREWTASIKMRLSTMKAKQPGGVLGGTKMVEVAERRAQQELDEEGDEEDDD